MSAAPRVVLALSALAERQVEPLIFDSDPPLDLVGSIVDAEELHRAISEQQPQAVLISPELSGLTTAHCERARAAGVRLVGLALDEHELEALLALGVDARITPDISREQLLSVLRADSENPSVALVAGEAGGSHARPTEAQRRRTGQQGSIVAVLGVRGAPGVSELAASLAALACRRWGTVLVEVDALAGGGLAARLGADPGDGSLIGLIRATQAGEGAPGELVERWLLQPAGWPAVLLGAPDPQALGEAAEPGAITAALDVLAGIYPVVVCDLAHLLSDAHGVPVHAHREAVLAADAVLLVLGAREAQLHHALRQLDLLLDVLGVPAERLRLLAGPLGEPGSAPKTAITSTITARLVERGLAIDVWLPWDGRGARRAQHQGTPIALARAHGPYARTVKRLLTDLFLDQAPKARRRKRRLPAPPAGKSEDEVVWDAGRGVAQR